MRFFRRATSLSILVWIILSLVIFAVLSSVFFIGHGALYNAVKRVLPRADTYINRATLASQTDSLAFGQTREAAVSDTDEFVQAILSLQRGMSFTDANGVPVTFSACFAKYKRPSSLESFFRDFQLSLISSKGGVRITMSTIAQEAESQTGSQAFTAGASFFVKGLSLGVVRGSSAQSFYHNWLSKDVHRLNALLTDFEEVSSIRLRKDELVINPGPNEESYEWDTEGGSYYFYIHDDHLIFFPTRDGGLSCSVGSGLFSSENLLDDDCFQAGAADALENRLATLGGIVFDKHLNHCVEVSP